MLDLSDQVLGFLKFLDKEFCMSYEADFECLICYINMHIAVSNLKLFCFKKFCQNGEKILVVSLRFQKLRFSREKFTIFALSLGSQSEV